MFFRRRAANAVEAALVMPVLFAGIAGAADLGWYMQERGSFEYQLRDAARQAALQGVDGDSESTVESYLSSHLDNVSMVSWSAAETLVVAIDTDGSLGEVDSTTYQVATQTNSSLGIDVLEVTGVMTHAPLFGLVPIDTGVVHITYRFEVN